jgi:hypothetical protein
MTAYGRPITSEEMGEFVSRLSQVADLAEFITTHGEWEPCPEAGAINLLASILRDLHYQADDFELRLPNDDVEDAPIDPRPASARQEDATPAVTANKVTRRKGGK